MTERRGIITYDNGKYTVPDEPVIPYIEGDGTGRDIWKASVRVFDAAVRMTSGGKRKVRWLEVLAGEKAFKSTGNWLPDETLDAIKKHRVAIKGPLTTPVGAGIRSINVALRQLLDLYACVRPVRYFEGVPAPVKRPQDLNVVIFRENTEDVYAGIEFKAGSPEANRLRDFLITELKAKNLRENSAIGIKPMSEFGSKRLIARAIRFAIERRRASVTLVHKGNIMKFTEGAFRDWGYALAKEEFGAVTIAEPEVPPEGPGNKVVMKDRIADSVFQQMLLRPKEYAVLAMPNLNGDYLSDACAAQVGGLGLAPGANIGDGYAVFEATHGTAPKYADLDKINPGGVIMSGVMMFEHLGWDEVATAIVKGVEGAMRSGFVTYDMARQMANAHEVGTAAFADKVIECMA
jgi:isocitrate dehydrogenase